MRNNVQLITYADRICSANIDALATLLDTELAELFSGVHLLPFFYPIDGSDAGFDPIDHTAVDQRLGDWHNISKLGEHYDLMADLIVNHMSAQSEEFQDVLAQGENSPYWSLFLTRQSVFVHGMTEQQQQKIYRPRPGSCFSSYNLADGSCVDFWTTFTSNQIDIDVHSLAGQQYLNRVLQRFADNKVNIIRLDAAGYAIKKAGTSCFMLDETFEFINRLTQQANALGIETLVEIHSYYQTQIEIAKRVDLVYDFALPPLILHTLFSRDATALVHWLSISPRNCITVLDTHDGIGIIDVGAMNGQPGLLSAQQIDNLVDTIHRNSGGQSKLATGAAASNVDLYQVNCSFYDALAQNDLDYLLARALQFFSPGVPQVYYAGLLAQPNDMALLSKTNVGRDINRPYLTREQVQSATKKPVVQALFTLIKLRNRCRAFNGEFSCEQQGTSLQLAWQAQHSRASLVVDFAIKDAELQIIEHGQQQGFRLSELLQHCRESAAQCD